MEMFLSIARVKNLNTSIQLSQDTNLNKFIDDGATQELVTLVPTLLVDLLQHVIINTTWVPKDIHHRE